MGAPIDPDVLGCLAHLHLLAKGSIRYVTDEEAAQALAYQVACFEVRHPAVYAEVVAWRAAEDAAIVAALAEDTGDDEATGPLTFSERTPEEAVFEAAIDARTAEILTHMRK